MGGWYGGPHNLSVRPCPLGTNWAFQLGWTELGLGLGVWGQGLAIYTGCPQKKDLLHWRVVAPGIAKLRKSLEELEKTLLTHIITY